MNIKILILFMLFVLPLSINCQSLGDNHEFAIGTGAGIVPVGKTSVSDYRFFSSYGYKISERFAIGLGLSYKNYANTDWFYKPGTSGDGFEKDGGFTSTSRIAVWTPYLHGKYIFTNDAKVNPFAFVHGGYGFAGDKNVESPVDGKLKTKGGLYSSAGAGIQFPVFRNTQMLIYADYNYQRLSHKISTYELINKNSSVGLNIGIIF